MLKKIRKNKKGFTLLEVTLVIAILGILVAIATPNLNSVRRKAAIAAHNANVRTLTAAATMYISDKGIPENDLEWNKNATELWKDYLKEWPDIPKVLSADDLKNAEKINSYTVTIGKDGSIKVQPREITD
jgi:type IV pilus assembly protein PilA